MPLSDLFTTLEQQPSFRHGRATSLEGIKAIEDSLRIQLPEQFKEFLQRFGFALWEGHAIYGLYDLGSALPPSFDLDAVRQTTKQRQRPVPAPFAHIAAEGIVIKKYEAGGFYFLFGDGTSRAGQVVLFQFGEDESEVERVARFRSLPEPFSPKHGQVGCHKRLWSP